MKHAAAIAITAAIAMVQAPAARADNEVAKILGVIGAGIMIDQAIKANKKNKGQANAGTPKKRTPSQPSPAKLAAIDLQTALNNFGFDAGPVDGQPGNKTRAAVASYQGTLGHPQTGEITAVERQLLLDSLAQERLNPPEAAQLAATNPFGRAGLPAAYRNKAQAAYATPVPVPVPAVEPAPAVPPVAAAGAAAAPPAALDQLVMPSFGVPTQPARSINGHCNNVSVLTTTNGGFASAAAMPDPRQAMNEQFCLARTFAIAEGQKVGSSVGASQEQISTTCGQLKTRMTPIIAGLESASPPDLIVLVKRDITASGKTTQEMAVTGRICLGEAYRTDDAAAANVAALVLAASDQTPYAEVIGHHLREGFGVTANAASGKVWMDYALGAVAGGAAPVFLPGQAAERSAILSQSLAAN